MHHNPYGYRAPRRRVRGPRATHRRNPTQGDLFAGTGPDARMRRFEEAARQGDPEAAYALYSAIYREHGPRRYGETPFAGVVEELTQLVIRETRLRLGG